MMKLYGVLVLFVTFSVAFGLRCYSYATAEPNTCTGIETCPETFDRCTSITISGLNAPVIVKGCVQNASCVDSVQCCNKDLCNGAVPTGPGVILLLLSSALMMLFI